MNKSEALERLDDIDMRLRSADNPIRDHNTSVSIGSLVIAVSQLAEIVKAMIPDEIVAAQYGVQSDGTYVPDASDIALKDMIEFVDASEAGPASVKKYWESGFQVVRLKLSTSGRFLQQEYA